MVGGYQSFRHTGHAWYAFTDPNEKGLGEKARKRRMSFVDGGYVDNSGVATASKLAQSLSELIAKESFNDVDRGLFVAPPV